MIRLIAIQHIMLPQLLDVLHIFAGRHAGYLVELFVEMRMIGITQLIDDGRKVIGIHVEHHLRGSVNTVDSLQTLGRNACII